VDDEIRFASAEAQLASLEANQQQLEKRVRTIEKFFDTLSTPVWKRAVYRLDGWGPWWQVRPRPRWRPWRRWFTS
jgi:hypothetical protein